jgi:hypothetical protein
MRLLLTIAAYLGALVAVAVVAFFVVIFLAGPHAGLLPHALEAVVLILGWLSVLVLPVWAAWTVWRRGRNTVPSNPTPHTDARDMPASANGSSARAGGRER